MLHIKKTKLIGSFISFHDVEPEIAAAEVRVLNLLKPQPMLPAGGYAAVEYYCPDPECDCRTVLLRIAGEHFPQGFLANISYSFDRDSEMAGPLLDPVNPQTERAPLLLEMMAEHMLYDPAYVARLERHYAMVKQAAADPDHPAYAALRRAATGEGLDEGQQFPPVGRNDPCPCGSGLKYKQCHGRRGGTSSGA